ncbi:hypothetical protein ACIPSE_06620 [Streptomyces sp. NPDC090106]|uniref:hypothetical protein n=1 Tax=Streptomyces sp. NPDC090106 TaxID=3365946 RepID=UPI00381A4B6B
MAINTVGLIAWSAAWIGQLYGLVAFLSPGFALLFAPTLCYALYRSVVQLGYFPTAFRMRRVLQFYPWQLLTAVPRGVDEHPAAEDDGIWIELPDPAGSAHRCIPLTFVSHHRSLWWLRHIGGPRTKAGLKAQLEPLWFSGDPRFLGVVAVSAKNSAAPRRLHFLYQPSAFGKKAGHRGWEAAGPADSERAHRAGARIPAIDPA